MKRSYLTKKKKSLRSMFYYKIKTHKWVEHKFNIDEPMVRNFIKECKEMQENEIRFNQNHTTLEQILKNNPKSE